jgi:uncharacterized membrane protein
VDLSIDERSAFINDLAQRITPGFDFFVFSALAGIIAAAAILLDAPALYILAALLAPFMAPAVGLGLATIVGSFRFFFETISSILISAVLVFIMGAFGGWLSVLWPNLTYLQATYHTYFSWPDFLLLTLGSGLTTFLLVRVPQQRPLVTSVALAYELYLPIAVAGFGLTSRIPGLWPDGLVVFFVHLAWAALVGTLVLAFLGLRPLTIFGYTLASTLVLVGLAAVVLLSGIGAAVLQGNYGLPNQPALAAASPSKTVAATTLAAQGITPSPSLTVTVVPLTTSTLTLPATNTPTATVPPEPTPVWAKVNSTEYDGAVVRDAPKYGANIVTTVENNQVVQVLPETEQVGSVVWVHVRIPPKNIEGWMVQALLITATPPSGW